MPNHVTNNLEFHCDANRCQEILEYLRVDGEVLGSIDFNKLIPMPEALNIESGSRGSEGCELYRKFLSEAEKVGTEVEREQIYQKYVSMCGDDPQKLKLGKQYYENLRDYGATDWYEWRWDHWGTKWNAYDYTPIEQCTDRISFNTAWSSIPKIIEKLSEHFNDQTIAYRWADENIGYNVGEQIYMNGQVIYENIPVANSKDAYELAADIRGIELSEYGFGYSEESGTYEYRAEAGDVEL